MKPLCLVLVMCIIGLSTSEYSKRHHIVELDNFGYYWRPWSATDDIPDDAVPGGTEKNCPQTFIARTLINFWGGHLIPGKLCAETKKMTFEVNDQERVGTYEVEILCALNRDRLKWAKITNGDRVATVVEDKEMVIAGYDSNRFLTIGRYVYKDEVIIGKILHDSSGGFNYMTYTKNRKGFRVKDGYEILLYDNNKMFLKWILSKCLIH